MEATIKSALDTWEIKLKTIFKHNTNSKIHQAFKKTLEKWFLNFIGLKFPPAIRVLQQRSPGLHWNLPLSIVESKSVFLFWKLPCHAVKATWNFALIQYYGETSTIVISTCKSSMKRFEAKTAAYSENVFLNQKTCQKRTSFQLHLDDHRI